MFQMFLELKGNELKIETCKKIKTAARILTFVSVPLFLVFLKAL